MKNKRNIYFLFLLIILLIDFKSYSALDSTNIIDKVISETKSEVVEYGIRVSFYTRTVIDEVFKEAINNLEISDIRFNELKKSNDSYYLGFYGENIEGYMETYKCDDSNKIIIQIIRNDKSKDLHVLQESIGKIVTDNGYNSRVYSYVKLKTPIDSTLESINKNISKILMNNGANKVESLKINNGYSSMAYTKGYSDGNLNQRYKSMNYAVCEYVSGNYIIMGTPEIFISY